MFTAFMASDIKEFSFILNKNLFVRNSSKFFENLKFDLVD